jgi:hypothetical protein
MSIPKSGVEEPMKVQVGTLYSLILLRAMGLNYLIGQQTTQVTSFSLLAAVQIWSLKTWYKC